MSLKARLVGTIGLALVGVLLASGILNYRHAQNKVAVEMGAAMVVARNTVDRRLADLSNSYRAQVYLEETIDIFDGDRHVSAALVDGSGREIARSAIPPPANEVPEWFLALVTPAYPVERIPLPLLSNSPGGILLYPDPRSEVDEVWADVRLNLSILLLFTLSAFGLVWLIIGRALSPIHALAEAMRRIGKGDYAVRVSVSGSPELALLCRGCNDMTAHLSDMSERNRQLSEQLIRLQEEERADLARELHDEVGPLLFTVDVDVGEITRLVDETGGGAMGPSIASRASSAKIAASRARVYVRDILGRLRPGLIGSLGLQAAVRELADFHRRREPDLDITLDLPDAVFPAETEAVVLAVVREALVNAVKHASASRIEVSILDLSGEVAVAVSDDGSGLGSPGGPPTGYGLIGMRERVRAVGGTITIADRPNGRGTAVSAVIPIPDPKTPRSGGPTSGNAAIGEKTS